MLGFKSAWFSWWFIVWLFFPMIIKRSVTILCQGWKKWSWLLSEPVQIIQSKLKCGFTGNSLNNVQLKSENKTEKTTFVKGYQTKLSSGTCYVTQNFQMRENWPGVLCVSKPGATAEVPRRLPAAPTPSAARLCQTQPTLWETATGGTPAWPRVEGGKGRKTKKCVRQNYSWGGKKKVK